MNANYCKVFKSEGQIVFCPDIGMEMEGADGFCLYSPHGMYGRPPIVG